MKRDPEVPVRRCAPWLILLALGTGTPVRGAMYSVHDLGTLGGLSSYATAINAAGHIVGSSDLTDGTSHAFLYDSGGMHDLGTLGGPASYAAAINAAGQIVGWSSIPDGTSHAF